MPLVNISLIKRKARSYLRAIADGVHQALQETYNVPAGDRFHMTTFAERSSVEPKRKPKQAISHYQKAVGEPAGLAELRVFYCELAAGFCKEFGNDDEDYLNALVRMFEQALSIVKTLPVENQDALLARLDRVHDISRNLGYGVGDTLDDILAEYT